MHRTKKIAVLFVTLLAGFQFLFAGNGNACACCANPGDRYVSSKNIDAHERDILNSFKFSVTAHVSGEQALEDIRGVTLKSYDLSVSVERTSKLWTFSLDDGAGNSGRLFFSLPSRIRLFQVDTHSSVGQKSAGGRTLLYKEWKLITKARGTGMLAGSVGGKQRAALIFHGRGNRCPNPEDFTAWTLVLYGPKAEVTFFGKLMKQ